MRERETFHSGSESPLRQVDMLRALFRCPLERESPSFLNSESPNNIWRAMWLYDIWTSKRRVRVG